MLSTFCENFYLGLSEQEKQQIELRLASPDPSVLFQPIPIEYHPSSPSSATSPTSNGGSSSSDSDNDNGINVHITTTSVPEETNHSPRIVLPLVSEIDLPDQLSPQSSAQAGGSSLSPSLHPDPSPRSVARQPLPTLSSQPKVVEVLKPSPQPSPLSFRTQKISPDPLQTKISPPASPQHVTSAPVLATPSNPARYHRTDSIHHSPTYQTSLRASDIIVSMPAGRDSSDSTGSNNSVSSTSTLMNEKAQKPASRCPCWGKRQKKG